MENGQSVVADDAAAELANLALLGAPIPLTPEEVFALSEAEWRDRVLAVAAFIKLWSDQDIQAADRDLDGSVQLTSSHGFSTAVMLLLALGPKALPKAEMVRERFTSVDRVAAMLFSVAQTARGA